MAEPESSTALTTATSQERPQTITHRTLVVEWLPAPQGLRVVGEVDLASRDVWAGVLTTLLGNNTPGRLDLSDLSFIDIQGAAALVNTARRMAPTTRLTLYRPPLALRRTLDLFWPSELPTIVIEEEAG